MGMCAQLCLTLCDSVDCSPQAPLSLEFSRQEYWSGLPFPSPGDLPNPGFEFVSPASPELASGFFTTEPPGKPFSVMYDMLNILNFGGSYGRDLSRRMTLLILSSFLRVQQLLRDTKTTKFWTCQAKGRILGLIKSIR